MMNSVTISIGTLARFTDNRAGDYAMSDLKEMTGTDSFLALPESRKVCQSQDEEVCKNQKFIKDMLSDGGCVPWALSSALPLEVCVRGRS